MVDRILIERIISDIKANVKELREATDITWDVYRTDKRARRYVERTLHITIEACIDVAQHIISEQGFREPTSYRDVFLVLAENGIISPSVLAKLENMASLRNLIVHYYERLDDSVVFGIFKKNLSDFDLFVDRILDYLERVS
ncbi:MAG: DUF86 domain-containing protein [Deltaproteobacteria bacterium]|nr:DUF86 domain-containing protein [Deltaproteobacteria bacterium]